MVHNWWNEQRHATTHFSLTSQRLFLLNEDLENGACNMLFYPLFFQIRRLYLNQQLVSPLNRAQIYESNL